MLLFKSFQSRLRNFSTISSPLDILFFGSDEFSCHSLKSLMELKESKLVNRVQVVTKKAKRCGRYFQNIDEMPIVPLNDSLGLPPTIRCETVQDMMKLQKLGNFQMIIAVSFGQLIPQMLIENTKYTLNVHPSLLPLYRGSSPIQHTLLNQDLFTGVTIQTLHPTKFDHGSIICQSEQLFLENLLKKGIISSFNKRTPPKVQILMDQLGIVGGKLLSEVISNKIYLNPPFSNNYKPTKAPKITTVMKRINWGCDTVNQILAKNDALGSLYAFTKSLSKKTKQFELKRVIFSELAVYNRCNNISNPGEFEFNNQTEDLIIQCLDGAISCKNIQLEGFKQESVKQFIISLKKRCGGINDMKLY